LGEVVGKDTSDGDRSGVATIGAKVSCDVGDLDTFGCVVGVTTGDFIVGGDAVLGDGVICATAGALAGCGTGMSVARLIGIDVVG
jgi:hypothetical protein